MYLLIALTLIAATIWGIYFVPRLSLVVACGAYLIIAGVLNFECFHFDVAGISVTADRLALAALLLLFAVNWFSNETETRGVPNSEWLLYGFATILLVSTFTHDWRNPGFGQAPVLQHLFEGYLVPFMLYWIARRATINQRGMDVLYGIFAVFGLYLSFTAFCEVTGQWNLVFPKVIGDQTIGIHFGRARGPFLQSVRMGLYLLVCLYATWIPLVWQRRWGKPGQALGFVLFAVYGAAIFCTYTRSVWLGLAVSMVIVSMWTFPAILKRVAIVGIVAAMLLGVTLLSDQLVSVQRETSSADSKESTEMRKVFAYVSWQMFLDRPVAGFGFGHFAEQKLPYLNDHRTSLRLQSIRGLIHHNGVLSVLVELGGLGLLTYLLLLGAWSKRAYRLWSDAQSPAWMRGQGLMFILVMVATLLQMCFHEISYSPVENGVLFMMAGLMCGIYTMRQVEAPIRAAVRIPDWSSQMPNAAS